MTRKGKVKGSKDLPLYTYYIPKSQFTQTIPRKYADDYFRTFWKCAHKISADKGFRTNNYRALEQKNLISFAIKENTTLIRAEKLENSRKIK
nr:hypothetical protein [Mycoplasmopsis bovis]